MFCGNRLAREPRALNEWILAIIGLHAFWIVSPIWLLLCLIWFKRDSVFMMLHIHALFVNPWLWFE